MVYSKYSEFIDHLLRGLLYGGGDSIPVLSFTLVGREQCFNGGGDFLLDTSSQINLQMLN